MDVNSLLSGVVCTCGREHRCDIEKVYIEKGAIRRLTELCEGFSSVLLVADGNTYGAAGEAVECAIGTKIKERVIFPGDKILIPNEQSVERVLSSIGTCDLIVGIGSGVIQDLCKYVSLKSCLPYMITATAPSMDGYASTGAAMILKGMKETVSAGLPKAIVADTAVLAKAPMEMIKAGYGDIIGKYSALNDWKLSALVNGEYFCPYVYGKTMEMVEATLKLSEGILQRDEESIGTLMEALTVVGILMSFAGSSRPASGSEHHLSHYFEIVGIINNETYLPHGIDVAYSTVITARLREELLALKSFGTEQYRETEDQLRARLSATYLQIADECHSLQERVGSYKAERVSIYNNKEKEIRKILEEMPSSGEISKMLSCVGLNISELYKAYGKEKILDAVKQAKDLKDRYTVLWMYYDMGLNRPLIDKQRVKLIAFDLDGTLTQHKQPMNDANRRALNELSKKYKLLMVGAGQVMRIFNQLDKFPIDVIGNYGMQVGKYDCETGEMLITKDARVECDREKTELLVTRFREKYGFTEFKGENVEFHPSGVITFPILGTKALAEDKLSFDPTRKKRRAIYKEVKAAFEDYNVFVGGSSSFDMAPKPYDKYYALSLYCKENGINKDEVVFVGDDYGIGGNDEAVYKSDIAFLRIDNYLDFPRVVEPLL